MPAMKRFNKRGKRGPLNWFPRFLQPSSVTSPFYVVPVRRASSAQSSLYFYQNARGGERLYFQAIKINATSLDARTRGTFPSALFFRRTLGVKMYQAFLFSWLKWCFFFHPQVKFLHRWHFNFFALTTIIVWHWKLSSDKTTIETFLHLMFKIRLIG